MATASDKMLSIKLTENDVPCAKFRSSVISEHSVIELKRWLICRGLNSSGHKQDLVERCRTCIEAGGADDIIVSIDEGRWYEKKVSAFLQKFRQENGEKERVPLLPTTGWQDFPSCNLPGGFCYGTIYEHLISSARTCTVNKHDSDSDSENLKDFGTSKPMLKGRQYFNSGHVKNIKHQMKGDHQFYKCNVMASYTIGTNYHVSLTLKCPNGNVLDATCDCKASSMGRCNHIASLLFAIEDYIMNFGVNVAPTDKLCKWNKGRKNKRDPKLCHSAHYSKKLKADRMIDFDPRSEKYNDTFTNNFTATLPAIQSKSMFEQVLEIEYVDYTVDIEDLKKMTKMAVDNFKSTCTASAPYEVENTRGQASSPTWHSNRSLRITASIAKEAASVKTTRGKYHLLNKHLWGKGLPQLKSLQYGIRNEKYALEQYKSYQTQMNNETKVTTSGLWINPKYPELASTPDGLIFSSSGILTGVVEIKCPIVLENCNPSDVASLEPKQRYNLCYTVENGIMKIKHSHQYYYQIQMQIAVCDVQICDFVVWSPKGILIERVQRDQTFWDDLWPKLTRFHQQVLLPEYIEMRIPRKLMPVDLGQ